MINNSAAIVLSLNRERSVATFEEFVYTTLRRKSGEKIELARLLFGPVEFRLKVPFVRPS